MFLAQAAANNSPFVDEKAKLENVRVLEPFLAEMDLLLGVMLSTNRRHRMRQPTSGSLWA